MTRNIKKYLLYCHSLCIYDPLPYLLDRFTLAPKAEYTHPLLPAVKHLLVEYAGLEKLIRKGILIPLSDAVFGFHPINDIMVTEEEEEILERLLKDDMPSLASEFPQKVVISVLGDAIRSEQFKARKMGHNFDLFFPHPDYVTVLKGLLRLSQERFSSDEVLEPFDVGVIGSVSSINPEVVSVEDIVRIRDSEELFEEWRAFLGRALRQLYTRREDYTDLDREFCQAVKDEFSQLEEKWDKKKRESSFWNQLFEFTEKAIIGAIAGGLTGLAIAGPSGAIAGTSTGVILPGVEFVRSLGRVLRGRSKILSLRHQFLALGAKW